VAVQAAWLFLINRKITGKLTLSKQISDLVLTLADYGWWANIFIYAE
jgi:hypothetical protein